MAFRSVPRPSSPPGAKASTECPSRARDQVRHAREQTLRTHEPLAHNGRIPAEAGRIRPHASEHRAPPLGGSPRPVRHCDGARSETHQIRFTLTKNTPFRATPRQNEQCRATAPTLPIPSQTSCFLQRPGTAHARAPNPEAPGTSPWRARGAAPLAFSLSLETIGFEPTTPCLQSRCSPS